VWFALSAVIERITHSSSAWRAMCGNSSLTCNPLRPRGRNAQSGWRSNPTWLKNTSGRSSVFSA
jgi:hypothetical protein